jgi:fructose-1,6-bisphosphate aldolase class II
MRSDVMVVNTIKLLDDAKKGKYAIPQFNINNLEWTKYILEECEILKTPVILGVSESSIKYMGGYKTVYNMATGLMEDLNITIPVVLHLDHGKDIEVCKKAIDNGFSSVMIGVSMESIEENIRRTKEVVLYAHEKGVSVEAEMGHIGSIEGINVTNIAYAEVEDCIRLVNETNIDSLAAALGNVHGLYNGESHLNFDRMKEITEKINKPLVLHGGTGVIDEQIKEAIDKGITKININTGLQTAWSKAVREYLVLNQEAFDPRKIIGAGEMAIKNVIKEKVTLFNSANKA